MMDMKNTSKTQRIVLTALLAALTCVATMVIKIPSPMKGYLNLGDCIVLLSAGVLPPVYAFLAAGLGSALADVFSGYAVYAPATFVIKGIMTILMYLMYKFTSRKMHSIPSRIISGTAAEVWMVVGYFLFEGCLYGFAPSAVNIPANAMQGAVGLALGCILIQFFEKNKNRLK